jgi:glycosyltransferase involved in cell wall biosynthesis
MMCRGTRHRDRYAMVAPNSSLVPPRLLQSLAAHATEILVPSAWAAGVVEEQTPIAVRVVPHGVHQDFAPAERSAMLAKYAAGAFDVIHLSTSERERKGTRALIEAWSMLMAAGKLPSEARLRLVLDMEAASRTVTWMAEQAAFRATQASNVIVAVRLDAAPTRLCAEYQNHHLLCQPSRGEAFGLCGLEALASGVPVVATACTGHSEWFHPWLPGALAVEHGPNQPIDDLPGAVAPEVTPDAIAAALLRAYTNYPALAEAAFRNAAAVAEDWAWPRKLAPFMKHLKETSE